MQHEHFVARAARPLFYNVPKSQKTAGKMPALPNRDATIVRLRDHFEFEAFLKSAD
jgi:hypothetical protein